MDDIVFDMQNVYRSRIAILAEYNIEKHASWDTPSKRIGILARRYGTSPVWMARFLKSNDQIIPREFENLIKQENGGNEMSWKSAEAAAEQVVREIENGPEQTAENLRNLNDICAARDEEYDAYCDAEEAEHAMAELEDVSEPDDDDEPVTAEDFIPDFVPEYKEAKSKFKAIGELARKNGMKPLEMARELESRGLEIPKFYAKDRVEELKAYGAKGGDILKKTQSRTATNFLRECGADRNHSPRVRPVRSISKDRRLAGRA